MYLNRKVLFMAMCVFSNVMFAEGSLSNSQASTQYNPGCDPLGYSTSSTNTNGTKKSVTFSDELEIQYFDRATKEFIKLERTSLNMLSKNEVNEAEKAAEQEFLNKIPDNETLSTMGIFNKMHERLSGQPIYETREDRTLLLNGNLQLIDLWLSNDKVTEVQTEEATQESVENLGWNALKYFGNLLEQTFSTSKQAEDVTKQPKTISEEAKAAFKAACEGRLAGAKLDIKNLS